VRGFASLCALFVLALTPPAGRTAVPQQLNGRPTSGWLIDVGNEQCTAQRIFRSDDRQLKLRLQPLPTTENVAIMVELPETAHGHLEIAQVELGDLKLRDKVLITRTAGPGRMTFRFVVGRDELIRLAATPSLKVSSAGFTVHFPVFGLSDVVTPLDTCISQLLARWGLDEKDQARLAKFPVPKKPDSHYINDNDYPQTALNRRAIGQVEARVTVSTDGLPSDCQLVRSSGHPDLDLATCRLILERARFRPALDRTGQPMVSPHYFSITWSI
jgi:TonB family protein